MTRSVSSAGFAALVDAPAGFDELGDPPGALVVDWSDGASVPVIPPDVLATVPMVIVGVGPSVDDEAARWCDAVVPNPDAAGEVVAAVDAQPAAAVTLALLLRGSIGRSITDGLVAESATYSALQAGAGHRAWLDGRPPGRSTRHHDQPAVTVDRDGDRLTVTLARPAKRNAYNAQMRDELLAALAVAAADPAVAEVELRGEGPAFSAGGDLDEFGSGTDPAVNHLVRVGRSTAAALARLADRITVRVHGPCVGAGVELPAFAHRVVAAPDATFRLPELAMGLVPGAGGTVSLPRRIGRHRTAWLALTGRAIDGRTALTWGLVDAIDEPPS
jgi:enoyl-CoA hydratase/carnithine racemase